MTNPATDLTDWLGKHGLAQYAALFAEHHIDESVLPDLSESDLEKLGISLGHRKKLLRAIAALESGPAPPPETPVGAANPPPAQHREPELRHITVVFCDLVGSTQLAEKLDPEDLVSLQVFVTDVDAYKEALPALGAAWRTHLGRHYPPWDCSVFGSCSSPGRRSS